MDVSDAEASAARVRAACNTQHSATALAGSPAKGSFLSACTRPCQLELRLSLHIAQPEFTRESRSVSPVAATRLRLFSRLVGHD